jgi:nicotinamide riboside transporter PnuC
MFALMMVQPELGEVRYLKRFAWLPLRLTDTHKRTIIIWLRSYNCLQEFTETEWIDKTNSVVKRIACWMTTRRWVNDEN